MGELNSIDDYLTPERLRTRIETHLLYSEHPDDIEQAVLDAIALEPGGSLLDVGSGTGSFLARLRSEGHQGRLVGLDTSPAAIETLRNLGSVEAVQADAAALPFSEAEFSVVTARHMLYHVADPAATLRQARRVLAPGGWFAATVNFPDAYPQTLGLVRAVVTRHGIDLSRWHGPPVHTGNLPGLMETVFENVETVLHANALVFPTADAFSRYAVAQLGLFGVGDEFPQRAAVVDDLVAEAHRRFDACGGALRDPKGYSLSVANA